ncbi:general secretion pathway protein GspK [Pseudoalteromonas apostichopi]|uniref:general secretion pathway protein GspK n=1 Tax=Pseudoalteromonas apostichopi TaxID=3035452 RepID=UPI002574063D|nr:type II secretion system protein GspK [Pseudoalteromonas sp. FE4]
MRLKAKQQGVALFMVLMITAIMAVIMIYMSSKGQNNARLTGLIKQNTDAVLELESVQAEMVFDYMTTSFGILGPRQDFQGKPVSNMMTQDFRGSTKEHDNFTVKVQDIGGLVSILPYNEKDFLNLLVNNGLSSEQVPRIKDRIKDWQDEDSLTHIEGAEKGDYAEPNLPTNDTIQSVKELEYIIEDNEIYSKIEPYLVLYSGDYIVRQYMPNSLYSALGLTVPDEQNASMEGSSYPSGRYKIEITFTKNLSITKSFTLLRGVDSFRPYFITDDELIFQ